MYNCRKGLGLSFLKCSVLHYGGRRVLLGEIVSEMTIDVVPTRLTQAFGDIFELMILSHIGTGVDVDRLLGSKINSSKQYIY